MGRRMNTQTEDRLADMLSDGWAVIDYSVAMMAAGGMVHCLLLQRDTALTTVTIGLMGEKEIGRTFIPLSPAPAAKTGWF